MLSDGKCGVNGVCMTWREARSESASGARRELGLLPLSH